MQQKADLTDVTLEPSIRCYREKTLLVGLRPGEDLVRIYERVTFTLALEGWAPSVGYSQQRHGDSLEQ